MKIKKKPAKNVKNMRFYLSDQFKEFLHGVKKDNGVANLQQALAIVLAEKITASGQTLTKASEDIIKRGIMR